MRFDVRGARSTLCAVAKPNLGEARAVSLPQLRLCPMQPAEHHRQRRLALLRLRREDGRVELCGSASPLRLPE